MVFRISKNWQIGFAYYSVKKSKGFVRWFFSYSRYTSIFYYCSAIQFTIIGFTFGINHYSK